MAHRANSRNGRVRVRPRKPLRAIPADLASIVDRKGRDWLAPSIKRASKDHGYAVTWLTRKSVALTVDFGVFGSTKPNPERLVRVHDGTETVMTGKEIERVIREWLKEDSEALPNLWPVVMLDWMYMFWVSFAEHRNKRFPEWMWRVCLSMLDRVSVLQVAGVPKLIFAYKYRAYLIKSARQIKR